MLAESQSCCLLVWDTEWERAELGHPPGFAFVVTGSRGYSGPMNEAGSLKRLNAALSASVLFQGV